MKRKLAMIILTLTLALCSILGLTACGGNNDNGNSDNPPHIHEFTTLKYDTTNHWFECECGDKKDIENHKGGTATCQVKATCSVCDTVYGDFAEHEPKTAWVINDTHHYNECVYGCTVKLNYSEHSFTNYVSNKDATCEKDGTKTAQCDGGCGKTHTVTDVGSMVGENEIRFTTLTVDGKNVYGTVSNSVEKFYFDNEIIIGDKANFIVSLDEDGIQSSITKSMPLSEGDNTFYVLQTINGVYNQTYIITIHRRKMFTVTFNTNGGTAVDNQIVEEDSFATAPTTTKAGYDFVSWDYDFAMPITTNKTIKASWNARNDTPYRVEYYLENLENEEYTLTQTNNLTGVTDTTAYAEIKTFEYFTAEKQTVSGNINGNGTTVLKVYYQRNEYTVSNTDKSLGSITGARKYKYGKQVTLIATPNLGYDFIGWYNGNTLLNSNLKYKVTIDKDITAKFAIKPEMTNFNFTSTATTCSISGVKNKTITEITVPNYVTSIGDYAFSGCWSLEKVNYLGTIDSWVSIKFSYSSSNPLWYAKNLYINGELVTQANITTASKINDYAFSDCDSLTSVVIGDSVTSIGDSAFASCDSLTSVVIGNSVTSIGDYAFSYCDSLTSVVIGDSVTSIGREAFYYCDSLTSVVIGNSVTSIGGSAFGYCYSLTSVVIGDSVTSIGEEAFRYCSSLTSVVIGDSVTSIGDLAFCDCDSLTSVVIGDSVTSIGKEAFYRCNSLTSIMVDENNENYKSIDGNLYSKDGKTLIQYAIGKTDTAFTIPNSVTSIGEDAFYDCYSLTSVVISDSVTSIGKEAFYGCYKLVEVINKSSHITVRISTSNGYLGYYALAIYNSDSGITESQLNIDNGYIVYTEGSEKILVAYNGSQTNLTIPNYITKINDYAFYNCISLTSIVIPNSVTSIGDYAFRYCTSLTSLVIGDSVTSIGDYAFYGCDSLTSIEIPDSVTSIGYRAFRECTSLTSVVIGDSVTSIGDYAFSGCYKLVEVINKSSHITVTKSTSNGYLGYYALAIYNSNSGITESQLNIDNGYIVYTEGSEKILVAYNGSQTNLTIPNYITKINDYAFYNCISLTSIVIPNSVTSIGDYAFSYCDSLTSVVIGDSVTSIGKEAFYRCNSLTSIEISDSVTSIGDYAFRYCTSLTSLVIGDSVTSIGDSAFEYCTSLTSIKYRGTQAQWSAITKGTDWNYKTGNYRITYNYTGN